MTSDDSQFNLAEHTEAVATDEARPGPGHPCPTGQNGKADAVAADEPQPGGDDPVHSRPNKPNGPNGNAGAAQPLPDLESRWMRPETLPDLHGTDLVAVDLETNDARLRSDLGPGHAMRDGYITGVSLAFRADSELRKLYVPIKHPETDNFDPQQVFAWLRHLFATVPRLVFHNVLYDCGWLSAEANVPMPSVDRLHDTGALATIVNENLLRYRLNDLCKWRGIPGKDETLLIEAIKAKLGVKPSKKNPPASFIWQLPAHLAGPYAEQDACATLMLFEDLYPILDQEGTGEAYRTEIALLPLVQEMTRRGIRIDLDLAERNRDYFRSQRDMVFAELSSETRISLVPPSGSCDSALREGTMVV
jgi:hypothetical protein